MAQWLKKLFQGDRPSRKKEVQDAVLGLLRFDHDEDGWKGAVRIGKKTVKFIIHGDTEPNPALLLHAHDIVKSFEQFENRIAEFLATEAQRIKPVTEGKLAAEEIRQLAIEDICLPWPSRPNDGMIYFKGPSEDRVRRCDYIGRKPVSLGCDT